MTENRKPVLIPADVYDNLCAGIFAVDIAAHSARDAAVALVACLDQLDDEDDTTDQRAAMPHCDQRILHAPGECEACDQYADWQELRRMWGIAYTGRQPDPGQLPCPADHARPADSPADHRRWPGNRRWSRRD